MDKLSFGEGNAKLAKTIATFSLPSGWTCPGADKCLSKSDRITGKLTDGPGACFRCFSAMCEARATSVRNSRWRNFELLKAAGTVQGMADLIQNSLPWGTTYVRIHVAGDFFSESYFKAWLNVAINSPAIIFYAYTKSLPFWVRHLNSIPPNFRLTASKGGKFDSLIQQYELVSAEVVFSTEEARWKGLEIDHDDSLAIAANKKYSLLLHGGQAKGTPAGDAWNQIRRTVGGYSRNGRRGFVPQSKSVKLVVA